MRLRETRLERQTKGHKEQAVLAPQTGGKYAPKETVKA